MSPFVTLCCHTQEAKDAPSGERQNDEDSMENNKDNTFNIVYLLGQCEIQCKHVQDTKMNKTEDKKMLCS